MGEELLDVSGKVIFFLGKGRMLQSNECLRRMLRECLQKKVREGKRGEDV